MLKKDLAKILRHRHRSSFSSDESKSQDITKIDEHLVDQDNHDLVNTQLLSRAIVALIWIFFSSRFFVTIGVFPPAGYFSIFYGVLSILILILITSNISEKWLSRLDVFLGIFTILAGIAWTVALVYTLPSYGTDEAALTQGAAQVLLGGHNPYGANLANYLQEFGVQPNALTYTMSGSPVTTLGYPSLSFIPDYFLLLVGITRQDPIIITVLGLAIASLFTFFSLPKSHRPFLLILIGTSAYFSEAAAGLIYNEMLIFIVPAFYYWEKFHEKSTSFKKYVSPICFGLACAVVQDAWFFVPFLLVGIYFEATRRGLRPFKQISIYSLITIVSFVIVNIPFIVWDPLAWVKGSIGPLLQPLVPLGQGMVGITMYLGMGGGDLKYYTYAAVFAGIVAISALIVNYPKYKFLIPVMPALILFLSTRSLNEYAIADIFILFVCVGSWKRISRQDVLNKDALSLISYK